MPNMLFANNCNTTLSSSLTNVATTMSVTSATGFPVPTGSQYFYCTLADAATQTTIEIVKVTAVSGTTFTIVRGQDGTSGTAFASGAVVSLRLVSASLNDFPKLDENNTFTYAPTFNTALGVASGGTGVTSATGTGAGAAVVLNQAPAINSPVITAYSTSTVPLKVCGLSGQFTELFDVYTYNGGTLAFQINSSGAIATGTWNGSVIGAAYGGTGEAGTLTGILYGNGTSAHTVATTAQLLSGIGTLPVANGGTGLTSLTAGYVPFGNGTSAFASSANLTFTGSALALTGTQTITGSGIASQSLTINGTTTGANFLRLTSTGADGALGIESSAGSAIVSGSSANATVLFTIGSTPLQFGTASNIRTTIFPSGGVSIGNTTDPGATNLSVTGNTFIGLTSGASALTVHKDSGTTNVAEIRNLTGTGNVAAIYTSLESNGNSTNSYHLKSITQGVNIWYLYGNGTTSFTSDERLKKNIETARSGYLDDLMKLNIVKYNWKSNLDTDPKELGLIAQQVAEVFPGLVQDADTDFDGLTPKVLKGSVLPFILIKALQELNDKFDAYVASHP